MTVRGTVIGQQYNGHRKLSEEATKRVRTLITSLGEHSAMRLLHTSDATMGKMLDGLPVKAGAADRIEARLAELEQGGST